MSLQMSRKMNEKVLEQKRLGTQYDISFYNRQSPNSKLSASIVVPFLVESLKPKSVIDVGCGVGTWLSVFADNGVNDYLGVDGDWVANEMLQIPQSQFCKRNIAQSLEFERRFDLVISLEVAEHLPESHASEFVASLVRLSNVVLFSAAIPYQGGTHHVNEQWQDYWSELFAAHGYRPIDLVRPRFWNDKRIEWWYLQNTLIFASDQVINQNKYLRDAEARTNTFQLSLVHPRHFESKMKWYEHPENIGLRTLLSALPCALANAFRRRLAAWRKSR